MQDTTAGSRLSEAFRRAGLKSETVQVDAKQLSVSEILQNTAIDNGCDLLVMGGYGHSRLRDFVLGGATEGVLNNLLLPVLLSH